MTTNVGTIDASIVNSLDNPAHTVEIGIPSQPSSTPKEPHLPPQQTKDNATSSHRSDAFTQTSLSQLTHFRQSFA